MKKPKVLNFRISVTRIILSKNYMLCFKAKCTTAKLKTVAISRQRQEGTNLRTCRFMRSKKGMGSLMYPKTVAALLIWTLIKLTMLKN